MITLLWGAVCGVLGLLWFMVESMTGRLQAGSSAEVQVLWMVLAPICAIGAMVHYRRNTSPVSYGTIVRIGLMASLWNALALATVWIVVTSFLVPEYLSYVETGATVRALKDGENIQQIAQRIKAARMVLGPPVVYVVSFVIPFFVGAVASAVAGLGLRTKQPA